MEKQPRGDVFKALADASRRRLLDRLRSHDGLTLNQLCADMDMSRQAVSKHLGVLEAAGLVVSVMRGRHRHHYLNAVPLQQIVERWVERYRQHQAAALIRLKQQLENRDEPNDE